MDSLSNFIEIVIIVNLWNNNAIYEDKISIVNIMAEINLVTSVENGYEKIKVVNLENHKKISI